MFSMFVVAIAGIQIVLVRGDDGFSSVCSQLINNFVSLLQYFLANLQLMLNLCNFGPPELWGLLFLISELGFQKLILLEELLTYLSQFLYFALSTY